MDCSLKSYTQEIPFTLDDGIEIIIDGAVFPKGNSFSINLCAGHTHISADTALHFNPRLNKAVVVRNHWTLITRKWGKEERGGGFPFSKGAPFQVKIAVKSYAYKIYINDNFFTDFTHRIDKKSVRYLYIHGDITVYKVSFSDVPVPLKLPIYGALQVWKTIVINGILRHRGARFNVNLKDDPSVISCDNGYTTIDRIHKSLGDWGEDETHAFDYFPLSHMVPFEMRIDVGQHGCKMTVNNHQFCDFQQQNQYLYIQGDVKLNKVSFQP